MITCYLLGGLGNQLFQICNVLSYSIESGNRPAFADSEYTVGMTRRHTYWNTFFLYLRKYVFPNIFSYFPILREKSFTYNKLPIDNGQTNLILAGYFQSYKYFEKHKTEIFETIRLDQQKEEVKKRMQYNFNFDNTISLHFRIGDYKLIQDKHPILTKKYYANAIHYILKNIPNKNVNIIYFCEERDLFYVEPIINELKEEFNEKSLSFIPINPIFKDYEQLLIMSCCCYNIIANSTFSWWGAYFNDNDHKIICYPCQWFGPNLPHSTEDLFPSEWVKIESI
jgi:hypothetical protein